MSGKFRLKQTLSIYYSLTGDQTGDLLKKRIKFLTTVLQHFYNSTLSHHLVDSKHYVMQDNNLPGLGDPMKLSTVGGILSLINSTHCRGKNPTSKRFFPLHHDVSSGGGMSITDIMSPTCDNGRQRRELFQSATKYRSLHKMPLKIKVFNCDISKMTYSLTL